MGEDHVRPAPRHRLAHGNAMVLPDAVHDNAVKSAIARLEPLLQPGLIVVVTSGWTKSMNIGIGPLAEWLDGTIEGCYLYFIASPAMRGNEHAHRVGWSAVDGVQGGNNMKQSHVFALSFGNLMLLFV